MLKVFDPTTLLISTSTGPAESWNFIAAPSNISKFWNEDTVPPSNWTTSSNLTSCWNITSPACSKTPVTSPITPLGPSVNFTR